MAKYGSASAFLLVDGYNLGAAKVQGMTYKVTSITEPTHGIGDSWEEHTPAGLARVELTQEGAFFDDGSTNIHAAMKDSVSAGTRAPPASCAWGSRDKRR
jgi:hypothetical protein